MVTCEIYMKGMCSDDVWSLTHQLTTASWSTPILFPDAEVQAVMGSPCSLLGASFLYYKIRPKQKMQLLAEALEAFRPTALFYFMLAFCHRSPVCTACQGCPP